MRGRTNISSLRLDQEVARLAAHQPLLNQSINQSSIFQDYYKRYIQVIVESQGLIVAVVIQGQT